jgi:threonine aldolase
LTDAIGGVDMDTAPAVNSLVPRLPAAAIEPLREWCFFWDWDVSRHQVRWMTAWDTTPDDVATFARGVATVIGG